MRISDWSSDVCSSDLFEDALARLREIFRAPVNMRFGRPAIAPSTSTFLVIGLNGFVKHRLSDEPHVRIIDAHAKGEGGAHPHLLAVDQGRRIGPALHGSQARVAQPYSTTKGGNRK